MEKAKKRYLLTIRYAADAQDRERIISSGRAIKDYVERMSENECKLAWTGTDGASFGYLLKSDLTARQIFLGLMYPGQKDFRQEWKTADSDPGLTSPMRSGDSILVIEVGEDFHGQGFSNAWTWLQHH